jgi:uncharacterized protein (DUF58 family)
VSPKLKQLSLFFIGFYILILAFIIKLPHIVFIASFLWSFPLSSLILSYFFLNKIKVRVEFPSGLTQGEEGKIIHRIEKGIFPPPMLTSRVVLPPPLVSIEPANLSLDGEIGEERFFAVKRGVYRIKEVILSAWDFLGIFEIRKKQKVEGEMIIYPSYVKFTSLLIFSGRGEEGMGGGQPSRGGVEFASVREWQAGESMRKINWRLTAKWGRLFVVQHAQAGSRSQTIVIDCSPHSLFGDSNDNTFELSIKVAASLAWATLENGGDVTLVYADDKGNISSSRHTSFIPILEELARLEARSPLTLPLLLEKANFEEDSSLIILTSLPDDSLLPYLKKQREKGNPVLLLLMDASTFGKRGWFSTPFLESAKDFATVSLIGREDNLKERLEKIWAIHSSI